MRVPRDLALEERHGLAAARLAEIVQGQTRPLAGMHRRTALQVRQREVALAIAAVGGAQQREERRVLRDRQQLAIALGPALGREVEREDADFRNERIGHDRS
jgi:hypothetical protein